MNETHWLPGIIVLAGGVLIAALYLYLTRKAKSAAAPATPAIKDEKLGDLERRAQLLIDQLKELSAERHQLSAEQFAAEQSRLEQAAAAALRARDEYRMGLSTVPDSPAAKAKSAPSAPAAQAGFFAQHPEIKGALWGGGIVLFFVALGLMLSQYQRPRGEGETATGKDVKAEMGQGPGAGPEANAQEDAAFDQALAQVKANPQNLQMAAEVAHELIRRERWEEASAITERSLGIDPFHLESRIHRAVLAASRGEMADALKDLQHLADAYPDSYEAVLFLGALSMQNGDKPRALENFERYAIEAPVDEQPPQLKMGIALLRQQLGK